jgi:NitT/TauT family transport system substrate-binding protein
MIRRVLAVLAVALSCTMAPAGGEPSAPVTVRIASSPNDDVTPILYAMHAGLFAKAGLDVVFQKANSGSAVAAAVACGAIDIGKSSMIPLINAHVRGIAFVLVAPSSLHRSTSPDAGIVVAANGPVRRAQDLDGQVVSVAGLNDLTWLGTHAWVDKNGGDSSTIRFIEIPGSSVLSALEQGRIAAGTLSEPYITQDVRTGKARLLVDMLNGIAPRLLEAAWFTTVDYAAKNRDAVARFTSVVQQASAYCNRHPSETIGLVAAFTGIDPQTFKEIHRTYFATALLPGDIQPLIDAAAKYKLIPQAFDARELLRPAGKDAAALYETTFGRSETGGRSSIG